MKKYIAWCVLGMWAPLGFAQADATASVQNKEQTLAQYAAQINQVKTLRSRFSEEKHLALLSQPISSAGELSFDKAAQTLYWQYQTPFQNGFLIEKNNVYRLQGDTKQPVQNGMGRMMAAQLVVWLTLDFDALKQTYEIALQGKEIIFTPRTKTHKVVKQITVWLDEKNPQIVTQVKLEEPGGDFILWKFSDTQLNAPAAAGDGL